MTTPTEPELEPRSISDEIHIAKELSGILLDEIVASNHLEPRTYALAVTLNKCLIDLHEFLDGVDGVRKED
jgi:hypothetical protein